MCVQNTHIKRTYASKIANNEKNKWTKYLNGHLAKENIGMAIKDSRCQHY